MTELPAGFSSKRYNSRKKVAQAHGIPASAIGKPQKSAQKSTRVSDASAKSGADSFWVHLPRCKPLGFMPWHAQTQLMCSSTRRRASPA